MKPDFRIFKRETTQYWSDDVRRRAGRLYAVYLFDANRLVHYCELTPSYEMHYLGPTWGGGPEAETEEERQGLFEDVVRHDYDGDAIVHASDVDLDRCEKVGTDDESWARFVKRADGDEDEAYQLCLGRWSEYVRGNGWVY